MAFIVFEGLDGSGKSSLMRLLEAKLKGSGLEVLSTREPGGTPLGEELRQILLRIKDHPPVPRAELFLYQASRAQHVDKVIKPALQAGKWVICDRYTASSVAFQGAGRGLDLAGIESLNGWAIEGCLPDLTVLLDLDVEASQLRISGRLKQTGETRDRFESEERDFHERVRQSFLEQVRKGVGSRQWLVLEARHTVDELFLRLENHLREQKWL